MKYFTNYLKKNLTTNGLSSTLIWTGSLSMPTSKKAKKILESYKEQIRREYYGGGKDGKPGSLSTLLFPERLLPIKSQISEKVSSMLQVRF